MLIIALCLLIATAAAPAAAQATEPAAAPVVVDGTDVTGWTPQQLWTESDQAFHDGDYPRAIALLQRVVELDPADVEAYSVMAWLTWSMGDEPAARAILQRGAAANPDDWAAHWELGFHLYDRTADTALAVESLERSVELPPYPDLILRTLAHAYVYAGRPSEAVAVWQRLGAEGRAPRMIVEINLPKALAAAVASDAVARSGGVIIGAPTAEAPVVLADERWDTDGDGFAETRVLDLEDPADLDGEADFRVHYTGRPVIHKARWQWTSMLTDRNDDGRFAGDPEVVDADGDALADFAGTLAELAALREAAATPAQRRFLAPDRYVLELGPDGRRWPTVAWPRGGTVVLRPRALIASEHEVELRLLQRRLGEGGLHYLGSTFLPPGVYVANSEPGDAMAVKAEPERLVDGVSALVLELVVKGAVVDRVELTDAVLSYSDGVVAVTRPTPAQRDAWGAPPPPPAAADDDTPPEDLPTGPMPGHGGHTH